MLQKIKTAGTLFAALFAEQARALAVLVIAAVVAAAAWYLVRTAVGLIWGRRGLVCLRRWLLLLAAAAMLAAGGRKLWQRLELPLPDGGRQDWFAALTPDELPQAQQPTLEAKAALLVDLTGGRILYRKNITDRLAPASTAKLLTALTAWQLCEAQEWVMVGEEQSRVAFDASRAGLRQGDTLTVQQLTAAMLLPSGNDAAYALAAHAGRKQAGEGCSTAEALEAFRAAMQETARALGVRQSLFVTPDGYDAEGQYTTVQDLARIAEAFRKNEALAAIAGTPQQTVSLADGRSLECVNTNLLLQPDSEWYTPAVTGGKTGRSGQAGGCLVTFAQQGDARYLCIVMGSTETGRWADTRALLAAVGAAE